MNYRTKTFDNANFDINWCDSLKKVTNLSKDQTRFKDEVSNLGWILFRQCYSNIEIWSLAKPQSWKPGSINQTMQLQHKTPNFNWYANWTIQRIFNLNHPIDKNKCKHSKDKK